MQIKLQDEMFNCLGHRFWLPFQVEKVLENTSKYLRCCYFNPTPTLNQHLINVLLELHGQCSFRWENVDEMNSETLDKIKFRLYNKNQYVIKELEQVNKTLKLINQFQKHINEM